MKDARFITRTALFAALTAVLSQISFPVPFSPVPFSLGLTGVLLSGGLLDKKQAAASQAAFILVGLTGIPVFAGFRGGVAAALGPTGGYLLAYPFMAWSVAYLREKVPKNTGVTFASMLPALALCYAFGSIWLAASAGMSLWAAVCAGVLPYAAFDVIKLGAAAFLITEIEKRTTFIRR